MIKQEKSCYFIAKHGEIQLEEYQNEKTLHNMVKLAGFNLIELVWSELEPISKHGEIHQGVVLIVRYILPCFL